MNNSIVFIHGAGDSTRIWRLQVEQLSKNYQVFVIDLPGHGERPDTLPAEVTTLDYAQAVHKIIQDELHLERPIIGGHSLGGAIVLTMALEYTSDLSRLILIGTGARIGVHPSLLEAARATPEQAHRQLMEMGVAQTTDSTVLQAVMSEQVEPEPNILYRDLMACNTYNVMTRLHEISLPTLIICGADDSATPAKYSHFLHEHISGSTLCIIPNAGHYVMREQPEVVNSAIQEWLSRQ